ncbi:DDE-type integrase/transposase/recombinase [Dietzia kunjamensis]|uniref:DDE-type integrase/transposase/recombinase n=1 Tax=Dietzia maris TaxID=37915 RepID=A0ABT8H500_9ACTN|nr:DDE-type integrase/transposase/recombinase [Dietzia maris]MDN4507332.1 DDE-type integrase/transposase/recombinase [Dietzia maris]
MAERTAWKICSRQGWWSAFGKKRGKNGKKPGPPVHDDLCAVTDSHGVIRHEFRAQAPNQLWLADITEHWTGEGKLYLCAVKDIYSNRIVGYSIDSRMKSRLAVEALNNAVSRRQQALSAKLDGATGVPGREVSDRLAAGVRDLQDPGEVRAGLHGEDLERCRGRGRWLRHGFGWIGCGGSGLGGGGLLGFRRSGHIRVLLQHTDRDTDCSHNREHAADRQQWPPRDLWPGPPELQGRPQAARILFDQLPSFLLL